MRRLPMHEAEQDAPNYRKASGGEPVCYDCGFAEGTFCEKYDFNFSKGFTCDAWKPKSKVEEIARTPLNLTSVSYAPGSRLTEASLQRVMRHYKESGFAMFTSWRGDLDKATNKRRFAQLKRALRDAGYGFIPVTGVWHEEGMPAPQEEPSLLIPARGDPRDLRKLVVKLGKRYDQDAVVWGSGDGSAELIWTNAVYGKKPGEVDRFSRFDPRRIGSMYTRIKKRRRKVQGRLGRAERAFTLASSAEYFFALPPRSSVEAMARQGEGELMFIAEDLA